MDLEENNKETNKMPVFICEKCGKLDNSANCNNFWLSQSNKYSLKNHDKIRHYFNDEYFDTHSCCSLCCKGLKYEDGSSSNKFIGDGYNCVTEKTYKEMRDEDIKCCENYEEIMERDREI